MGHAEDGGEVKYCPNRECPYAVRRGEAPEYREEARLCSDCGTALVNDPPVWSARRERVGLGSAAKIKIGLTLLVPLLVVGLGPKIPLPCLNRDLIERQSLQSSIFALGLAPVFSAFLVVEFVALCVPRWRSLRTGGPRGRGRLLTATWRLSLTFGAVQALGVFLYLRRHGLVEADTRVSRLVVVLSLMAGTCVLVLLAWFLDQAGLAGGFSVLALTATLPSVLPLVIGVLKVFEVPFLATSAEKRLVMGSLLLLCAGTFYLLRRQPRQEHGNSSPLRYPACGVVPLQQTWAIVGLALALAGVATWAQPLATLLAGRDLGSAVLRLALITILAFGFGFLFNQPFHVWAASARREDPNAALGLLNTRKQVQRAVTLSTAYLLALGIIYELLARILGSQSLPLVPLVMAIAVLLDLVGEARAVRDHGELAAVWPEHRVYAVPGVLAVLREAGIPGFARGIHHRTLWHFFAPYIPIDILVPRARSEEASRLLRERLLGDQI